MKARLDKQGRIVIPKEAREKYKLVDEGDLEVICREDKIELVPISEETDPAVLALKEPCRTGSVRRRKLLFSREKAWTS